MLEASPPQITVKRFANLDVGDLFICRLETRATVALVAEDPSSNNERVMLVLGPDFPERFRHPFISARRDATAITFGKNYSLRLPVAASEWAQDPPPVDVASLMLTDSGDIYLRAWIEPYGKSLCCVDLSTGKIFVTGSGAFGHFGVPPGIKAFAARWELLTVEKEPRSIISFPTVA